MASNKQQDTKYQINRVQLKGTVSTSAQGNVRERVAVIIIGEGGAGKSLLANSRPHTFCLDIEGRAGHTGYAVKYTPTQDESAFDEIATIIADLKRQTPDENGMLEFQGVKFDTISLDTFDHLQMLYKMGMVGMWNGQQMYGELGKGMQFGILLPLLSLPVNVIIVCHTGLYDVPTADEQKENRKAGKVVYPTVTFALEGAIRQKLNFHFDSVLHLVLTQDGQHKIYPKSRVVDGRFLYAKDTLNIFNNREMLLTFNSDGTVKADALDTIFHKIIAGPRIAKAINSAKKGMLEAMKLKGYDAADAPKLLGEALVTLNNAKDIATIKAQTEACMEIIGKAEAKNKATEPAPKAEEAK